MKTLFNISHYGLIDFRITGTRHFCIECKSQFRVAIKILLYLPLLTNFYSLLYQRVLEFATPSPGTNSKRLIPPTFYFHSITFSLTFLLSSFIPMYMCVYIYGPRPRGIRNNYFLKEKEKSCIVYSRELNIFWRHCGIEGSNKIAKL